MATTKTMARVGVLSVGKVMGVMYTFIGLVAGGIMGFMKLFLSSTMVSFGAEPSALSSLSRGILPLLCFPIMYGILGFLSGLLMACIYNIVAGIVGGIELTLDDAQEA